MFCECPEEARLRMELATYKTNYETICRQFDDMRLLYEKVKGENAYLRKQLEID